MVDQQRKRRIHREGKTEREGGLIHRKLCKDVRDLEVNSFTVGKEFTLNGQIWTSIQIVVKGQGEERKTNEREESRNQYSVQPVTGTGFICVWVYSAAFDSDGLWIKIQWTVQLYFSVSGMRDTAEIRYRRCNEGSPLQATGGA